MFIMSASDVMICFACVVQISVVCL